MKEFSPSWISIYCGKVEDLLSNFRSDFFDACLCDPPYGLKFMGKSWDHGVPSAAIWKLVKQTLKPGAPILAFGGTRTYHRLACAIEDAGFEIFDSILAAAWIYGQGWPKGINISKAIDKAAGAERKIVGVSGTGPIGGRKDGAIAGHGQFRDDNWQSATENYITEASTDQAKLWEGYFNCLKPAWEPIVFARKPLSGTYAENCIEHGCGGLNIDGTRIAGPKPDTTRGAGGQHGRYSNLPAQGRTEDDGRGRYPANLILSHHRECEDESAGGCHPECPVAALDRQSGYLHGSGNKSDRGNGTDQKYAASSYHVSYAGRANRDYGSQGGGASRFFYCAKVSTSERNRGLPAGVVCDHPTLKPIDLCRYLATLILPPLRSTDQPRNLLVPFSGAGSEIIGAALTGWESITAIEKEENYIKQACYRIKGHTGIEATLW